MGYGVEDGSGIVQVAYYNEYIRCYLNGKIERLFRGKYWREVKQTNINKYGYLRIKIDGKMIEWHRVVWEAFNGKIPDGLTINHKDEIKTNNSLGNLEVMTRGDNARYSKNKPVIGTNVKTGEIVEFPSTAEAQRNGFYSSSICDCIKGKRRTHKGYTWLYK